MNRKTDGRSLVCLKEITMVRVYIGAIGFHDVEDEERRFMFIPRSRLYVRTLHEKNLDFELDREKEFIMRGLPADRRPPPGGAWRYKPWAKVEEGTTEDEIRSALDSLELAFRYASFSNRDVTNAEGAVLKELEGRYPEWVVPGEKYGPAEEEQAPAGFMAWGKKLPAPLEVGVDAKIEEWYVKVRHTFLPEIL